VAHGGVFVGGAISSALGSDFFPVRISRRSRDRSDANKPRMSGEMPRELKGRRVLIVDDVAASGDTLQMANGALFRNGRRVTEAYARYEQGVDEPIDMEGFGVMDPSIRPEAYGAKNHLPLLLPTVDGRQYRPSRNNWGPLVVPAGHYWLMGDNRDHSLDSRYMGPIPRRTIRGKPLFIYYSFDKQDADASFPRFVTAARWRRIGDGIR